MKTHLITIVVLTSVMSISGCGGEDGDTPTEVAAPAETATPPPADNPVAKTTTTGDLVSAPGFDLITANKLQVSLSASPSTTVSYFINICTDFSNNEINNESGDIKINYASCKLRTKVAPIAQQFTFSISPAEEQLIAQIWPIEDGAQPINIYWNIAESGKNWQINF